MELTFKELLDKLRSEHDESYFYRGQNRIFDYPLWPSMYRNVAVINKMQLPSEISKGGRGKNYAFRSNWLIGEKFQDEENIKLRELKRLLMGYARNALGYCLSEAMFQQAGWESEGLDITDNIEIALFFAMHYYNRGIYEKDVNPNKKVIYRWKLKREDWDFNKLNKYNYYNCPALFPSKEILYNFENCDSEQEFYKSIAEYREAIDWHGFFDYTFIDGKRPFEIIKIPKQWLEASRIVNQHAYLLFPDSISLDAFNANFSLGDKQCQEIMSNGGSFIEDLSVAYECEKFTFDIKDSDFDLIDFDESAIYIKDDLSHDFLLGWMKSFHQNPYGTPRIMHRVDDNYLSKLDTDLNFDLLRFENHEVKFNG